MTLSSSRVWHRARVISSGQQVWGVEASYQEYSDRFGADGSTQSLGRPFARTLTWKQLLNSDPRGQAEVRNYMRKHSVNENDVAATAEFEVNRQESALSADWAYGLTSKWMIGFQLPLTYRRTRVSSSVHLSPVLAGAAITRSSQRHSVLGLAQEDMRSKVKSLANQELQSSGYESVPSQRNSWDWGDIRLLSQVELTGNYAWTWSFQQMVRFPTARNPSVADYLQTNSDDGQVDLGLTSLVDFRLRRWTAGFRLGVVAQLPDSVRVHVPSNPRQIDPSVHRDLGDYGWTSLDVDRKVSRRFSLDAEYSFLKKTEDRYSGQSSEGSDYSLMGEGTGQELHQTRAGIQYRIGELSSRQGVENKWVASLGYTYPWIGRNSVDASRTSLELISYF